MAAFVSRLTRSSLLEVLGRDYVRTARAKGAREPRVIYRHALRNALLPVVTGLGLYILPTLSGSVAIELIFGRPGLGSMLINGIETRDYPVVQAGVIIFARLRGGGQPAHGLLYTLIDPRIRGGLMPPDQAPAAWTSTRHRHTSAAQAARGAISRGTV